MPTTCSGCAAAFGLIGPASSALVAIRPSLHRAWAARQTSADPIMVIGNIHPMIGEATRRCVQHVYKHCWKCRDVACRNQGATDSAYLPGIPLELLKAYVDHVANPNSLACRPILASSGSKILLDFGCWQPSADGTFGESRAETPPGIMVTANLAVFAITGVSGRENVIAWAKGDGS